MTISFFRICPIFFIDSLSFLNEVRGKESFAAGAASLQDENKER